MLRSLENINYFGGAIMQHLIQDQISQALFSSIDSLIEHREDFLVYPQTAFTRERKISFRKTVLFPMLAGSDNVANELLDLFGEKGLPLPSSMSQRRSQIKPEAFENLFFSFTGKIPLSNTFNGYHLSSIDGTRLNLAYNPSDTFTYIKCIKGRRGINQVHLNLLYDPLNDIFQDLEIQGIHQMNEKTAFCQILDRRAKTNPDEKTIFLADRGYASYNIFAHAVHNNQKFLIRVSEPFAKGMCPKEQHWLEGECFDEERLFHIGRRRTKRNLQLSNFHCIQTRGTYDFIEPKSDETDCFPLRVLKFPISEDSFEYIVTNLPKYAFSLNTIKQLYHLRWNEETAFRHLKYAGNMVHLHSLKWSFILQEIYGKLTTYNFTSFLIFLTDFKGKETSKHRYVINHTQALKSCNSFLKGKVENVVALILRYLVPVRLERKFTRNLRSQSADTFNYR